MQRIGGLFAYADLFPVPFSLPAFSLFNQPTQGQKFWFRHRNRLTPTAKRQLPFSTSSTARSPSMRRSFRPAAFASDLPLSVIASVFLAGTKTVAGMAIPAPCDVSGKIGFVPPLNAAEEGTPSAECEELPALSRRQGWRPGFHHPCSRPRTTWHRNAWSFKDNLASLDCFSARQDKGTCQLLHGRVLLTDATASLAIWASSAIWKSNIPARTWSAPCSKT